MARRKSSSNDLLIQNKLLIIGLILILVSIFAIIEAKEKVDACKSFGGQIVQFFSDDTKNDCGGAKIVFYLMIVLLAIGIALSIINFIKK